MAKVRKFNGGGMKSNWEGSQQVSPGHPSQSYSPTKNPATKSHWSGNGGQGGNGGQSGNGGGVKKPPVKIKPSGDGKTQIKTDTKQGSGTGLFGVWGAIKKWGQDYNLKKRTKFARDEGLYRDYYIGNRYNKDPKKRTLDVMSDQGKDYLKEAGYGPFQDKPPRGEEGGPRQKCPDGSMPPCPPVATTAESPGTGTGTQTNYGTNWQFYPTNSNYMTGEGYDEGGGVKFGPPPKKGPNPQVPPIKFSRGGGAAIRGTKFSGVK